MKKVLGRFARTRPWQQYVFDNPPDGYDYTRALDLPLQKVLDNTFTRNTEFVVPLSLCDAYHTYNSIVPIRKPWVVEVESQVPRYQHLDQSSLRFRWAVNRLQSQWCRHIIFTSHCTAKMNRENFRRWGIPADKCSVVYRAVKLGNYCHDLNSKCLRLLFVGNAFYRKGGMQLLRAFENLSSVHGLKLHIISNFEVDWEIFPSVHEKNEVQSIIADNENISTESSVSHDKVIKRMKEAHVFVSTTFADPFNNTVLEAMSCGCGIISSDVRALPEIVKDGTNGFLVNMNKKSESEIIDFIKSKIMFYLQEPKTLENHAIRSYEVVKRKFSIEQRNRHLKDILDRVL